MAILPKDRPLPELKNDSPTRLGAPTSATSQDEDEHKEQADELELGEGTTRRSRDMGAHTVNGKESENDSEFFDAETGEDQDTEAAPPTEAPSTNQSLPSREIRWKSKTDSQGSDDHTKKP